MQLILSNMWVQEFSLSFMLPSWEKLYFIIQQNVLLGMRYEDFSWDYARPSEERNEDCLPCLFIQFPHNENGVKTSKILQVFSKQVNLNCFD